MSSITVTAHTTPVVIPNLTDGSTYTIQNVRTPDLYFLEAESSPTQHDANVISYKEVWEFQKAASKNWYVWSRDSTVVGIVNIVRG